jgi:hypothetical protein
VIVGGEERTVGVLEISMASGGIFFDGTGVFVGDGGIAFLRPVGRFETLGGGCDASNAARE